MAEKFKNLETLKEYQDTSIYVGEDIHSGQMVLIKTEKAGLNGAHLSHEAKMLSQAQSVQGVPLLKEFIQEEGVNYLVMELLGPSLQSLAKEFPKGFKLKTTVILGL